MRRRTLTPAVLAAAALACCGADRAAVPVRLHTLTQSAPPQHLYVARIDLTDPRVSVHVVPAGPDPDGPGPWETTLQLPSVVARDQKFDLAVNGGFFEHNEGAPDLAKYAAGDPARATAMVLAGGQFLARHADGAVLAITPDGHAAITPASALPQGTMTAIGGSWQVVADGRNVAPEDNAARHARTAAGVSADGRTLILLVADGARPGWAAGLTLRELADAMIAQGCRAAINLDGGGSSTLVRRDATGRVRVVNVPSDGAGFVVPLSVQRPVAYVLGVRVQ